MRDLSYTLFFLYNFPAKAETKVDVLSFVPVKLPGVEFQKTDMNVGRKPNKEDRHCALCCVYQIPLAMRRCFKVSLT